MQRVQAQNLAAKAGQFGLLTEARVEWNYGEDYYVVVSLPCVVWQKDCDRQFEVRSSRALTSLIQAVALHNKYTHQVQLADTNLDIAARVGGQDFRSAVERSIEFTQAARGFWRDMPRVMRHIGPRTQQVGDRVGRELVG